MTFYEEIVRIQDDVLQHGKDMSDLLISRGHNLWVMKNHPGIGVHRYTSKMQPSFHGKITNEEMFELGMAMTTEDLHGIFTTHDVGGHTFRHVHSSTVTFLYRRKPAEPCVGVLWANIP